jgi:hypothetical protein
MPLIAAHFDISGSSFYIKKSKRSSGEMFNFPYVYSKGVFSNQCNQEEFHKTLIQKLLSDRNINPGRCDILLSGFMDPPEIGLKSKYSIGIVDIVESSDELVPVFINNCSFITKGLLSAYSSCENTSDSPRRDFEDGDQMANFCIYPNIVPEDLSAQSNMDSRLFQRIPDDFKFESGRKLVFTGGRFSQPTENRELNYILILETLRGFGFFQINLDSYNVFPISRTMQMYDRDLENPYGEYIERVGTFVRTGGSAECLLSTGIGNDQFIEIEEDRIFVLPLRLEKPAKLSVKSSILGTVDIRTTGGEIGLVFDTRKENRSIYSEVKIFNDCIKQFGEALKNK